MIYSHKFDLLAILNMDYWNLKVEIRKFNDCQPKANRIKLNQSRKVMLNELIKKLELFGAAVPVKNLHPSTSPPVEIEEVKDMSYTIVDVMESMTSLTVYEEVTLT